MESAQQPTGPHSDRRAGPVVPRERRLRLVLAVAAGVVALLCLGGAGIVFMLYDDATEINRGSPDVAVDNYLRAFLVDRDDSQARLFRCEDTSGLAALDAFRTDIQSREGRYSIKILVSWSSLSVTKGGDRATVSTDLRRSISDGTERISDRWEFQVVDRDGWRVCGATKLE